jgi:TolB protein
MTIAAARAHAVVTGAIYGPGSQAFSIAVVPLANQGGDAGGALGQQFARMLTRDLDLSGYFRILDPATFIERPEAALGTGDVDFVGWASIGAQALLRGTIAVSASNLTVEVRLFDVPGRHELAQGSKRFTGSRADLPRMAHRTADTILEVLTGERGPFDSRIALVSSRAGRLKDVYLWTFDRDEPTRLSDERAIVVDPSWRPDGRAVLFASYREHQPRLFQIELATKRVSRLVAGPGAVLGGAWSPDGSRLLAVREEGGNSDIFLADPSGRVIRQLTEHWGIDISPTWAPDGRRFAFCSARSGSPQIYAMNADGSQVERISETGSYNTSPAWSPKGTQIAYTTRAGGSFQIVVAASDGSKPKTIAEGEDPTWGPDGRYLVFSLRRGGGRRLMLADRDGRTLRELTHGAADDTSPAWSRRLEF